LVDVVAEMLYLGTATNGGRGCFQWCSLLLHAGSCFEDFAIICSVIYNIGIYIFLLQLFYGFVTIAEIIYRKVSGNVSREAFGDISDDVVFATIG
jgi:hypothetical protein